MEPFDFQLQDSVQNFGDGAPARADFQVLQAGENRRLGGIKAFHPGLRLDFQESGFESLESSGSESSIVTSSHQISVALRHGSCQYLGLAEG
jgi:hypothetical protein